MNAWSAQDTVHFLIRIDHLGSMRNGSVLQVAGRVERLLTRCRRNRLLTRDLRAVERSVGVADEEYCGIIKVRLELAAVLPGRIVVASIGIAGLVQIKADVAVARRLVIVDADITVCAERLNDFDSLNRVVGRRGDVRRESLLANHIHLLLARCLAKARSFAVLLDIVVEYQLPRHEQRTAADLANLCEMRRARRHERAILDVGRVAVNLAIVRLERQKRRRNKYERQIVGAVAAHAA